MVALGGFPIDIGEVVIVLLVVVIIHGAVYLTRIGDRLADFLSRLVSRRGGKDDGPDRTGKEEGASDE